MALKDITDKVAPVWQALKGIATGSKIISSEWNTVIENVAERTQFLRRRGVCDWDSTLSYAAGDFVQVAGVVYKALATNANKAPSSNPTYWEKCLMVAGEIAYTDEPKANGTASAGTAAKYARGDHVHPTDTSRAPLASPALTGTPTAPTAAVDTSTTQVATTAFVTNQASATTPLEDGTAAVGTSKRYARGDHVHPTDTSRAPLASPALTGTPTAPTAAVDTSTTQVATTAFVTNQASATTPLEDGTAAVGTSKRYARGDHVHPTDTSRAPVASPALTGTPTAPTATDGTNTTQIASTAFVQSAVGGYLLKSGQTGGTVTLTESEASNPIIAVNGTLTSNLTVVLPAPVKRLWAIYNATSGAYTVTVKLASGTGVTVAQGKRNLVYTDGSNVYDGFNDFESIAMTGVPTAPNAAAATNNTQIATTNHVHSAIIADRPWEGIATNIKANGTQAVGTLNTVARGDHVHPTDTSRAPVASPALTGTPTAPTAADGTNTTQIASTAFVQSAVGGYLLKSGQTGGTVTLTEFEASNPIIAVTGTLTSNLTVVLPATVKRLWAIYNATSGAYTVTVKLASGTGVTVAQGKRNLVYTDGSNVYDGFNDFENVALTGTSTAPTAAVDTSTTQVATTAFVINQASSTAPVADGTAAVGTSKRYARGDHVHPTDTTRAAVSSFANSKATSGWQKLEGGLIIQWGYAACNKNDGITGTVANLPIAFPNNVLAAVVSDTGSAVGSFACVPVNSSQLRIWSRNVAVAGAPYESYGCNFIAIGY